MCSDFYPWNTERQNNNITRGSKNKQVLPPRPNLGVAFYLKRNQYSSLFFKTYHNCSNLSLIYMREYMECRHYFTVRAESRKKPFVNYRTSKALRVWKPVPAGLLLRQTHSSAAGQAVFLSAHTSAHTSSMVC